ASRPPMPNLSQHVCFTCRKVFKKHHEYAVPDKRSFRWPRATRRCPQCGGEMVYMGYKFRAPRMADMDQWHRIERALKEGRDYAIRTMRKQTSKLRMDSAS